MKLNKREAWYYSILVSVGIAVIWFMILMLLSILLFSEEFWAMAPFIIGLNGISIFATISTMFLSKKYSKSHKLYQYTKDKGEEEDELEWADLDPKMISNQNKIIYILFEIYFLINSIVIALVVSDVWSVGSQSLKLNYVYIGIFLLFWVSSELAFFKSRKHIKLL